METSKAKQIKEIREHIQGLALEVAEAIAAGESTRGAWQEIRDYTNGQRINMTLPAWFKDELAKMRKIAELILGQEEGGQC